MQIKLYRSATVGIIFDSGKILCDPWLTDGEYYGSWSHFPKFNFNDNLNELNSYDYIYISHIHPDHSSENTMKKLDKSIPVIIHNYHSKFLKAKIERLGFQVIELNHNVRTELKKNLYINILAADDCNPELCFKFIGCANFDTKKENSNQIDTLAVIDNNINTIVNTNDCPFELSKKVLEHIQKEYTKIDILLNGYGGAGAYPQCFENLDYKNKVKEAETKKINSLNQSINFINYLKPDYYLPFAGTYTLTGKLSNLQNLRGVPDTEEAINFIDKKINNNEIKSITMNYETIFDFISGEISKPYIPLNKDLENNYIKSTLSKIKLDYENDNYPNLNELFDMAKVAYERLNNKRQVNNVINDSKILLNVKNKYIKLSLDKHSFEILDKEKLQDKKYIIIDLDLRLLARLLKGPKYAHWNNAEIGSHIKYYRNPNVFERSVYYSLSFFHC